MELNTASALLLIFLRCSKKTQGLSSALVSSDCLSHLSTNFLSNRETFLSPLSLFAPIRLNSIHILGDAMTTETMFLCGHSGYMDTQSVRCGRKIPGWLDLCTSGSPA
jgi:hypothetical protein